MPHRKEMHLFLAHDFGRVEAEDARIKEMPDKKARTREPLSRGERVVIEMLTAMGVDFCTEKSFGGLYSENGNKLRFDLFFPDVNALLEIHGAQHFKPSTFQGTISPEEAIKLFEQTQIRDRLKKQYALTNGFTYIEVPYLGSAYNLCRDVRLVLIKHGVLKINKISGSDKIDPGKP